MATSEEEIVARLGLDASPFAKGLRSAETLARGWAGTVSGIFKGIAAPLTGILTGAGIASGLDRLLDRAKAITNLRTVTGASTDFIQGFEKSTRSLLGGIENSDEALVKFTEKLGEARLEGGRTAEIFQQLGVDFRSGGVEDVFRRLADRFAAIPDPAERARFAMELFGKGAVEMGTFLAKGTNEIDRQIEAVKKLSDAQLAAANTARAAINSVKETTDSFIGRLAVAGVALTRTVTNLFDPRFKDVLGNESNPMKALAKSFLIALDQANADAAKLSKKLPLPTTKFTPEKTAKEIEEERKANLAAAVKEYREREEAQKRFNALKEREKDLEADIARTKQDLITAQEDQYKFTLAQIANTDPRTVVPGARPAVFQAREAMAREAYAHFLTKRGIPYESPRVQEQLNRADALRRGIPFLTSKERDPFGDLVERLKDQNKALQDLLDREKKQGIQILPKNAP